MGRDVVAGCRDAAALATTEFVQPALLACDVAAFRVLEAEGASFVGVAGHSLGEFAALVAADVVPLGDALDLVVVRGAAMQRAGEERPGAMTALLGVGAEDAAALCDEARRDDVLVVANENSPGAVGDLRLGLRDRAGRGAREGTEGPRGPIARRRRVPLAADGTGARRDRRTDRRDRRSRRRGSRSPRTSSARSCPTRRSSGRSLKRHVVSPVRWESSVRALADAGTDLVPRGRPRRRPHQADEDGSCPTRRRARSARRRTRAPPRRARLGTDCDLDRLCSRP